MHGRSLMLARRLTLMCEDLLAATTTEHSDLVITSADLDGPTDRDDQGL